MFRHPNSRTRIWRICYHPERKKWDLQFSLKGLASKLLAPMNIPLKLDFSCYWMLPPRDVDQADVYETDLSACQVCTNTCVKFLAYFMWFHSHRTCISWVFMCASMSKTEVPTEASA